MVLSASYAHKHNRHRMLQEASEQAAQGAAQALQTTDNPMYNMRRTSLSEPPSPAVTFEPDF